MMSMKSTEQETILVTGATGTLTSSTFTKGITTITDNIMIHVST